MLKAANNVILKEIIYKTILEKEKMFHLASTLKIIAPTLSCNASKE